MDANVILKAIQFNHDRDGATHDAFNIRFNETTAVEPPEWRRGITFTPQQSPAAYAIKETRGNTLTIKARFTGTANSTVLVRAVQARPDARQTRGCNLIARLWPASSTFRMQRVNVLGEVKERKIKFDATGETGFKEFELENVLVQRVGISVSTTEWRWQFRATRRDRWTDFAITKHRIYTVLEIPNCPWQQTPFEDANTQLPWAEALEYACDWAAGAQDADEAATQVTQSINDLGLSRVSYSGSSLYANPDFNCTQFLNLLGGGRGRGETLNCSDCATIVSSFSNLIGCNLRQLQFGPDEFLTHLVKKIGAARAAETDFFGHEVAWKGAVTDQGKIFDACLQLDQDEEPATLPFLAFLPTNIAFGATGEKHYGFRLSSNLVLLPETLACRKIGRSFAGGRKLTAKQLEFLKVRYDFEAWRNLAPKTDRLSVDADFLQARLTKWNSESPEWRLERPIERSTHVASPGLFELLGFVPGNRSRLLRIDAFELQTWQKARDFMLHMLGDFHQLNVQRLLDLSIGDVSFVEADDESVLFARSEFVVLVRSVGKELFTVREIASRINQLLS